MAKVIHGDISIDLRRATNADALLRETILDHLVERFGTGKDKTVSKGQMGYIVLFARIISQARSSSGVPWRVSMQPSGKEIDKGFDIFMELDEEFGNACWSALLELERPADPDLAPSKPDEGADPNASSAAPKSKRRGAAGGRG